MIARVRVETSQLLRACRHTACRETVGLKLKDLYAKNVISRDFVSRQPAPGAWAGLGMGATGHEWISGIAIEKLPDSVPAFVRNPDAAAEIAVMGRELDRSKGSGETHDKERDPGHYVDLADDGSVMGVLPIAKLPVTREAYDTQLRAKGFTQYKAGYLPYAIIDGWQQIRKDFAYWRAAVKGAETATTPEERAWFEADRRLREKVTPRDIGIWSQ